jgi:tetratricopeptide (TPR) repeat protein
VPDAAPVASSRFEAVEPSTSSLSGTGSADGSAYVRSVARLGVQAAEALEHAHARGVIHRDIKPANLLLDGEGNVWVADFGLARLQDDRGMTMTGDVIGTLRYMSPEQAAGSRELNHLTDVYSLGATLYELLALRPAIEGAGHSAILRAIASEDPRPLRRHNRAVPRDLETIVAKAMAKDPARRYPTAGALAGDLRSFLENRPISARRPGPIERATKWVYRHQVLTTAACVVAAAVAVAGASALVAHERRLKQVEAEIGRRRAEASEQGARMAELVARVDALVEEAQRLGSGRRADFPRAVALLSEAIAHRPNDPDLYLYRGSARHELGRHAEAISDLERSLELSPAPNPAAHWMIALAALQLGQQEKAREHQERAERDDPDNVQSLVAQALALGHDERGLALLDRAIEREPFDPALYFYRGRIAANLTFRHGENRFYERAVADLEKALLARPGDPKILEPLCDILLNATYLGDVSGWSRARERAGRLLEGWRRLRPTDLAARRQVLGNALQRGDFNLCLEEARACRRLAPDDPTFPLNMAWAYVQLHDLDAAERSYDEAARLGRSLLILTGRAACRGWHRGDREKTIRELAELRREFPPETWTYSDWLHFKNMYVMVKDWDSTLAVCEDYLRRVPGASEVHLWRGNALRETGDIKGALASLTRALELNPDHWHIYQVRGWTHVRGRDYEAALTDVDRFIASPSVRPRAGQATPDQMAKLAEAVAGRGHILRAAGRPAEAERSEREALALHLKIEGDGLTEGITAHSSWDTMIHYGQLAELIPRLCRPDEIPAISRVVRADAPRQASPEAVVVLGDLFYELAMMLSKTDAIGDQERAWRRAIAAYERACGVGEAIPRWSRLLARCHAELAELLRATDRGDEAQDQDRKAAEVARRWRTAIDRMLARKADDASEINGVAWWLATWPVPAMRDAGRAVELARRAVEKDPKNDEFRATLGVAYYRSGDWDRAAEALECTRSLPPEKEVRFGFFRAMTHWQRHERDDAREAYAQTVGRMAMTPTDRDETRRFRNEAGTLLGEPKPLTKD